MNLKCNYRVFKYKNRYEIYKKKWTSDFNEEEKKIYSSPFILQRINEFCGITSESELIAKLAIYGIDLKDIDFDDVDNTDLADLIELL